MLRAYLIIFIVHLCFFFQGCATSEHLEGSSKGETEKFKMTKEEMWNEIGVLNAQIRKLEEENQRIRDENQVLPEKLTVPQLKHETPSSKSYELENEGHEIESMYVQKRSVRVRDGPGIDYRVVDGLRLGERVFTKDLEGDWYRIVDAGDFGKTIGWIHGSLLGKMPPGQ